MAEFTISPIPYAGGTLEWEDKKLDLIRVNSTARYVYAFSQVSPNYKFYGIADVSNITGSSPSVSIIKQRAFTGSFNSVRLVQLDNDRFVSYDGNDLFVYNVSTNDVVEELKIAGYGSDYSDDPAEFVFPVKIANDVVLEFRVVPDTNPSTYKLTSRKLTYDTGTSTFTISINFDIMTGIGVGNLNQIYVDSKPVATDGTKLVLTIYFVSDFSNWNMNLQKIVIYDTSTNTIDDITPTNVSDFSKGNVIAFDTTAIVLFDNDTTNAIQYDGSSWSSQFTYASGANGAGIVTTGAFSPSYGVLIRKPTGSFTPQQWFYRIVNYQGPSSVVTSFPTNNDDGILVTYPSNFSLFRKKTSIDIYDPETFMVNGFNSISTDKQFIVLRYKP